MLCRTPGCLAISSSTASCSSPAASCFPRWRLLLLNYFAKSFFRLTQMDQTSPHPPLHSWCICTFRTFHTFSPGELLMIASPESVSLSPPPLVSPSPTPTRRPWTPDGDAHLIYQWVKMEGKSQSSVADLLGISQPTVSRTIQRYGRWQAHTKDREAGRLDYAERLRAQRWLTFERNELIMASCLRIANEIEGFADVSKSTICRPLSSPGREQEVRTQHGTIDRTGTVARFLRLAFRINMEQLKLAEQDEPPPALPLTDEELADEELQAAADAAEIAAARARIRGTDIPDCNAKLGESPPASNGNSTEYS